MLLVALALAPLSLDIEARIAEVLPSPEEEKWLSIPWRTRLQDAVSAAEATGKPIFLWIMNGHPMGCT
ncbi:MAG: hypothetical protein AKCLJLPJ_00562 [Fimbriimonadales bacterium]|nr:MAG: hypothetical protein EDM73_03085 [Armatimonadota bacterium]MBV6502515.1 hypothetical protein [Fimbriimonadales bacterium]MCE7898642.1 hypothetical protein [Armatimonadetes bacterium ATM1]MDL1928065.1 hypothetical protein [Fimbriimonadia bacterium ATM]MBC6968519.1 hypothetical protein [Armatimonadota bacterium]